MESTLELRNIVVEGIKKISNDKAVAVVEIDGNYFKGADIAIKDKNEINLYRVTICKYNRIT